MKKICFHCSQECINETIFIDKKPFCCKGCKTVYEIINLNHLGNFYELNKNAGIKPEEYDAQFDYLDDKKVFNKLVSFHDGGVAVLNLHIPAIHCTSCIWLLESLEKINQYILNSSVNFANKTVEITYKSEEYKLSDLVKLLTSLGYKPSINNESNDSIIKESIVNNPLILKIVVAGFCFGNIMLFTIPDYLINKDFDFIEYVGLFKILIFMFSLPVVFYCASPYFFSAWYGLKNKFVNIDLPIAIGVVTLFLRSIYEVLTNDGFGYFDSLAGLIFFMLIGKYFQERTYKSMSFDRNHNSFYPIAVCRKKDELEEFIGLSEIKPKDRLLIRNMEILPTDSILISGKASIDNSFITGESKLLHKKSGDKIFAGAKQMGSMIEVEVLEEVNQSYLSKLWQKDALKENSTTHLNTLTNTVSKYFSLVVLVLAFVSWLVWYQIDPAKSYLIVTSILIIACPCALGLSAPFTLGSAMRFLSKIGFYVKDSVVLEKIAKIDSLVFDKTGTLTENNNQKVYYDGAQLSDLQIAYIKNLAHQSSHPISRKLYFELDSKHKFTVENFKETSGKGIEGIVNNHFVKIGSQSFLGINNKENPKTEVWISIENKVLGRYIFENKIRKNVENLGEKLGKYLIYIISGDNPGDENLIQKIFPRAQEIKFNQTPEDKMNFVSKLQTNKQKVMMLGDGLNDAYALKKSDVGVAISDNINAFSPASDVIMKAELIAESEKFINYAKVTKKLIYIAFCISFLYNVAGLYYAISGQLEPKIAAILMPLSSITIVIFAVLSTWIAAKAILYNNKI